MFTTYLAFSLSFLSTFVGFFVIAWLSARKLRRTYDMNERTAILRQTGKSTFFFSILVFLLFGIFVDVSHSFLQAGLGVLLVWMCIYARQALSKALNCR